MNILFNIGVQIFEVSLFYMFLNAFFKIEERRKKYIIIFGTVAVIIFTFSNSYDAFNSLIIKTHLYNVLVYILILFILSIPYSGKIITKVFITFVFAMFSFVVEILVAYLICILINVQILQINYGTMVLVVSASSIIKLAVINVLATTKSQNTSIVNSPVNFIILMIPIISVVIIYCMSKTFLMVQNVNPIIVTVVFLGIIYINLVMYYLFDYMNKLTIDKINATLLKQEIDSNQELYKKILEGQSELRNIRHDLKNRLSGIFSLLQNNNCQKALSQISDIIKSVDSVSEAQYSSNLLINSILNYKLQQDKIKDITIKTDINISNELNIESGDLGVLIGNLLDNAIEACQYVISNKAYINIKCYMRINVFVIVIENSRSQNQEESAKKLEGFDKINHGRGIRNVKKIVEKYQGNIEINTDVIDVYKVQVTVLV